ncbi:Ankyrin-2 [Aspergillus tanneri]|uniref:Ankyrin-2 n=1 Tax=Aspergillus tanneri TaxID=1220188 RepID=A0A5M9MII8_9EURO|nr:Ankyrin-2 [Aspergillus tanneri]KAA8646822.1 Ankyrin-2 [Aspergillus tanneri]
MQDHTVCARADGLTLYSAAMNGHVEVLRLLLDKPADLNIPNNSGMTLLNSAAESGHLEVVRLLLDRGADITVTNSSGWTPLNSAADSGHLEVVRLLLDRGADLTVTNSSGWTPLFAAAFSGHLEVVRHLLDKEADLTVPTNDGWTPLRVAVDNGHLEVVRLLLDRGADLTVAGPDGWTPFSAAAESGHLEVVRLLLDRGADLTVATSDVRPPLSAAAEGGQLEVVRFLLGKGADLAVATSNGWTAVNFAAENGHLEVVRLLLDRGADLTVATSNSHTPLYSAATGGHLEVVRLLLDRGADLTVTNSNGWTPVNSAAREGHLEVVRLLLDRGADLTTTNILGMTPVDSAKENEHWEVVQLLLDKRADPTPTTAYLDRLPGFTLPLDYLPKESFPSVHLLHNFELGSHKTMWEVSMMRIMNSITDKPDWDQKIFDEPITTRWRIEVLGSSNEITPKMMDWVIDELRYKAELFQKEGIISAFDGDIVKSDTAISEELKKALKVAVRPLENIPDEQKDYHPGSNQQVVDLVHPSLFPLVYGRSRILLDGKTGLDDYLSRSGNGEVLAVPPASTTERYAHRVRQFLEVPLYSQKFQWLPCDVKFDPSSNKCHIVSYINNLRPDKHRDLYKVIEEIISQAIPLWNMSLTPLFHNNVRPNRVVPSRNYLPRATPEPEEPDEDFDESWDDYQERYVNWLNTLTLAPPEIEAFDPLFFSGQEPFDLQSKFRDDGLQVIVKLANIELTPEKPKYNGGSWRAEGQLNEHICATAIYYYSSENITSTSLEFRQRVETDLDMDENLSYGQDHTGWTRQRADWWEGTLDIRKDLLGRRLPLELQEMVLQNMDNFPLTMDEAKELRLELMEEQRVFSTAQDEEFQYGDFYLDN